MNLNEGIKHSNVHYEANTLLSFTCRLREHPYIPGARGQCVFFIQASTGATCTIRTKPPTRERSRRIGGYFRYSSVGVRLNPGLHRISFLVDGIRFGNFREVTVHPKIRVYFESENCKMGNNCQLLIQNGPPGADLELTLNTEEECVQDQNNENRFTFQPQTPGLKFVTVYVNGRWASSNDHQVRVKYVDDEEEAENRLTPAISERDEESEEEGEESD